jgi:hypothetical protein
MYYALFIYNEHGLRMFNAATFNDISVTWWFIYCRNTPEYIYAANH